MLDFQVRSMNLWSQVGILVKAGFESWMSTMKTYSEEFRICWDAGVQGSGDWFFVWWSETAGRHCSDVCFRSGYFVLDEPTTGMDATTKSDFMSWCIIVRITIKNLCWWLRMTLKRLTSLRIGIFIWFATRALLGDVLTSMIQKGGWPCLIYSSMILCSEPCWLWLPWVFFSCIRDFLDFETAESDEWYAESRLSCGCRFGLFLGISLRSRLWSLSL